MVETQQNINWIILFSGLFGGLALFLYGLDKMGNGIRYLSGYKLKKIVSNLTRNRLYSMFTGVILTAMMQSSSATMVLLVGFVSANMINLTNALGMVLGADIGTTITVQLITFKITQYALIPVAVGFFMKMTAKNDLSGSIGRFLLGFGLLFYGIEIMSNSMAPLRDHQEFINTIIAMSNPFYAIIIGAIFTATIQSSAAFLAIVIALASQDLINVHTGVGLVLGANIGTCITVVLASIGKNKAAKKTATAHVFFKVTGVCLILPFFSEFEKLVTILYPFKTDSETIITTVGIIANAHLVFNLIEATIFLPFVHIIARTLNKLMPDEPKPQGMKTKYIDDAMLDSPALALTSARREIYRMGTYVERMLLQSLPAIKAQNVKDLTKINKQDEFIDFLFKEITQFLIKLNKVELSTDQSKDLLLLTKIASDIESVGDLLERNIVDIGKKIASENIDIPEDLADTTEKTFLLIRDTFTMTLISVNHPNQHILKEVENKKSYLKRLTNKVNNDKIEASKENIDLLKVYNISEDLIDTFSRIFYYSHKIAKNLQRQETENDPARS